MVRQRQPPAAAGADSDGDNEITMAEGPAAASTLQKRRSSSGDALRGAKRFARRSNADGVAICEEADNETSETAREESTTENSATEGVRMGGYDPTQSTTERREIRREYRDLTKETLESKHDVLKATGLQLSEGMRAHFQRADELYARVRNPQEAVLDSRLLVINGDIFNTKTRTVKMGASVELDLDEFVARLKGAVYGDRERGNDANRSKNRNAADSDDSDDDDDDDDDDMDDIVVESWARLGKVASRYMQHPTCHEFLATHIEPRPRKIATQRAPTTRQFTSAVTRPQEVTQNDIVVTKTNTDTTMVDVYKQLVEIGQAVNMFALILNPESFAQSVENMFILSFLVHDNHAEIDIDKNGVPLVKAIHAPAAGTATYDADKKREAAINARPKQDYIFELDLASWRDLIDAFDIKQSIITTRDAEVNAVAEGASNKWYG
ncbi:Nse4 C-terminal-domain-containing protein [Limtongia smithiae]|uniref:Nse4 C-terminal-domain-containing protein n=1 Tax=Limtongia smithiae TaxID=1125753 RepID=UPI0034CEEDE0